MNKVLLSVLLAVWVGTALAADTDRNFVQVYDPYIEMHTGAGRGYPIFHVVNRDEWVEILFRQTDWFKVRTESGIEGWVARAQMLQTLNPDGQKVDIKEASHEDFIAREWEMGMLSGDFGGKYIITFYGAYHFTDNISVETSLSQALGTFSSSMLLGVHVVNEPFPEWVVSPYFTLGTGIIDTTPKTTLAVAEDSRDNYTHWGVGARMHLTRRFLLRVDYKSYVLFTSRDDNEEVDEWKAGFGFFF